MKTYNNERNSHQGTYLTLETDHWIHGTLNRGNQLTSVRGHLTGQRRDPSYVLQTENWSVEDTTISVI